MRSPCVLAHNRYKSLGRNARELRAKKRSVSCLFETGCRADDSKPLWRNVEAIPQSSQQQANFSACRASVKMRLIKDDEKCSLG